MSTRVIGIFIIAETFWEDREEKPGSDLYPMEMCVHKNLSFKTILQRSVDQNSSTVNI